MAILYRDDFWVVPDHVNQFLLSSGQQFGSSIKYIQFKKFEEFFQDAYKAYLQYLLCSIITIKHPDVQAEEP